MIYVLAGKYQQFVEYCRANNLHPHNDAKWLGEYPADALKGRRGGSIVITGTPDPRLAIEVYHYANSFNIPITDAR
jgi:hypothetical protein